VRHSKSQRVVYLGLMTGLAIGLHIFESFIPMPVPVPGAKLGLANIISLYVIINFGLRDAVVVTVLRTVLGSLLSGTFMTIVFYFSFAGGLISTLLMGAVFCLFPKAFSVVGISLLGAVTHNLAQIAVASFVVESIYIALYLPYMLAFALPTGLFVGLTVQQLKRRYRPS
jgi:heptaprenyl diphosphate synthase